MPKKHLPAVILRPSEKVVPVQYISSPEEVAMMLDRTNQLAVFKAGGPQGPPGPPGSDGKDFNSLYDVIISAISSEVIPLTTGTRLMTFRCPFPLRFDTPGYEGYIRASVSTAPVGADIVVTVDMNGSPMLTTPITIEDGQLTSVTAAVQPEFAVSLAPDDAEFSVNVTQVGSSVAGFGLKLSITGIKEEI